MNRIIGNIRGNEAGPLLILVAAVHGNERESLQAIENVFHKIHSSSIRIHGELLAIYGNLSALRRGERYIDYDLNRCFTESQLNYLRSTRARLSKAEDHEAHDLMRILDAYAAKKYKLKILADLHSTSAAQGNFVIVPEYYADHPLVTSLQLPVITNLETFLRGTLSMYACEEGFLGLAFEGGQIGSPEAVKLHEAGIWMLLHKSGLVKDLSHTFVQDCSHLLERMSQQLPRKVKVNSMHVIREGSHFEMKPGYYNFKTVSRGETLAQDKNGDIVAPQDGMIFMPLYQKQGSDGFFIVEEVE
ncbi:MAG: succinylglutamate desuccinylase/aspartoacylase family protein [Cyclobacteriaceae bacterium]